VYLRLFRRERFFTDGKGVTRLPRPRELAQTFVQNGESRSLQQGGANVDTLRLMESAVMERPRPMLLERALAARLELQTHRARHGSTSLLVSTKPSFLRCCRSAVLAAHSGGSAYSRVLEVSSAVWGWVTGPASSTVRAAGSDRWLTRHQETVGGWSEPDLKGVPWAGRQFEMPGRGVWVPLSRRTEEGGRVMKRGRANTPGRGWTGGGERKGYTGCPTVRRVLGPRFSGLAAGGPNRREEGGEGRRCRSSTVGAVQVWKGGRGSRHAIYLFKTDRRGPGLPGAGVR